MSSLFLNDVTKPIGSWPPQVVINRVDTTAELVRVGGIYSIYYGF